MPEILEALCMIGFAALVVLSVVVAGCALWAVYDAVTAETFSLRKDEWTCTASHEETVTTWIVVGNVQVPQITTTTVCDQWTRRR